MVEHDEPRSTFYIPECSASSLPGSAGDRVIMPAEVYAGERVTIGKYRDTGETFTDFTPWSLEGSEPNGRSNRVVGSSAAGSGLSIGTSGADAKIPNDDSSSAKWIDAAVQ